MIRGINVKNKLMDFLVRNIKVLSQKKKHNLILKIVI